MATDSSGENSEIVTVTITVTDVNEAPTFSLGTEGGIEGVAADHPENSLDDSNPPVVDLTVSTYTATDPGGRQR